MLDLKALHGALAQLEEERNIPKNRIIEAIEAALAAAYRKDYGKKNQIIRAHMDMDTGKTEFIQVKIVADETTVRMPIEGEEEVEEKALPEVETEEEEGKLPLYNSEKHIMLEDARKIKADAELGEEIIFPLEPEEDFGRIAAQTAKQVIMQGIREAEREGVIKEYGEKEGDILTGIVQKVERGNVFIDFNKVIGVLPKKEQIPGEFYRQGSRIKVYLYQVEQTPRGINLWLSRTHPELLRKLFAIEAPEVASGVVEIKSVVREPGNRSKVAVWSNDDNIDPIGSMVGQKGVRVTTVMNELHGEKIDIIEWNEDPAQFVSAALSPAKVLDIEVNEDTREARVEVADDQLSLAIGKGGQNARLAARLTGWKIDIRGIAGETLAAVDEEGSETKDEGFTNLKDLKNAIEKAEETQEEKEEEVAPEKVEE
jgi:N utilization substance protein A